MTDDGGYEDDNLIVFPGGRRLRPRWMAMGACIDEDTDLFFSNWAKDQRRAVAICDECPVEDLCLEHALENGEDQGVWGGKTEAQRKKMMKERGK